MLWTIKPSSIQRLKIPFPFFPFSSPEVQKKRDPHNNTFLSFFPQLSSFHLSLHLAQEKKEEKSENPTIIFPQNSNVTFQFFIHSHHFTLSHFSREKERERVTSERPKGGGKKNLKPRTWWRGEETSILLM